jgi:hypothetical protein
MKIGREYLFWLLQKLFLPLRHLVWMHLVSLGQFHKGLPDFERLHGYLHFECSAVVPSGSFAHLLLLSWSLILEQLHHLCRCPFLPGRRLILGDERKKRQTLTAIYDVLAAGQCSRWHSVRSDEVISTLISE